MKIFLHDIPLPEAQSRFQQALQRAGLWKLLSEEEIPLDEHALGRVLSRPVWAKISSPHYHASAMDGFAIRAEETTGASEVSPIILKCNQQAIYLDTGDMIPDWANAVIPIENVIPLDENGAPTSEIRKPHSIAIRTSVVPWHNIRPIGEDIVATELLLPSGHSIRAYDLGAMAACGHSTIYVARKPKVAILPTGSELVAVGQPVRPGEIIEFNSIVLAAQIISWGGEAYRYPITKDALDAISDIILQAGQTCDLILLNAGSSAGSEDYAAQAVQSLGTLLVHGVAVRPGHPVILGMLQLKKEPNTPVKNVPIIGVPGYPVSAALTGEIFVEPLLAKWLGRRPSESQTITACLTQKITSPAGDDDFVRVSVGKVGNRVLATPLSRGAGVITSLVKADGIVIIPRGSQGLSSGDQVRVKLFISPHQLERTIYAVGSHDLTLDLLAQFLASLERRLVSANVGSLGGLIALKRGETHLAGSHLLDPESGEYNISFIKQYLPNVPVIVVGFVTRQQGLLVQKGNPKKIHSINDLERPEVSFVNRQRGSGTRVLLDYQLKVKGINPQGINGYHHEEFTHLALAATISSGRADCGLGIAAAAQALDLDFIPLFQERYDLIIPTQYYYSQLLEPLIQALNDETFRNTVAELEGYSTHQMGVILAET